MRNIKLLLGYDGSNYHGFQVQQNAVTVQELLEKAVGTVCGHVVRVTPAGRTDTGVHATGQTVNFRTTSRIPCERLPYALNAVLPPDIVVYAAEVADDTFHARYSATGKVYAYHIDNAPHPRVMERRHMYHVRFPLDTVLMQKAAGTLLGTHDFRSFMAAGSSVKTTVRTLRRLDVDERDRFVTVTAEADGFLYNMVRIITGTLIEVGRKKRDPDLIPVLIAKNRDAAGYTAPPHGLILREVKY